MSNFEGSEDGFGFGTLTCCARLAAGMNVICTGYEFVVTTAPNSEQVTNVLSEDIGEID